MKVSLPHIGYTVVFKDRSLLKEDLPGSAYCERTDKNTSTIYMKLPVKSNDVPTLAHETVHALKNICLDRHMTFENEVEHMGYMMQHIMCTPLGLKYINP